MLENSKEGSSKPVDMMMYRETYFAKGGCKVIEKK